MKKIMIVEDEALVSQLLARMVSRSFPCVAIVIARTPEEQSELLASGSQFAVVFQDINTPDGEFPYQEAIVSDKVDVVVMMSSETPLEIVGGKVVLCRKPFGFKDFKKVVEKIKTLCVV